MRRRVDELSERGREGQPPPPPPLVSPSFSYLQLPQVVLPLPLQEVHFLEQLLLMVLELAHGGEECVCEREKTNGGPTRRGMRVSALCAAKSGNAAQHNTVRAASRE